MNEPVSDSPRGYRVHTNTWTAYGKQLPVDEVLKVLDRINTAHITAAVESLRPADPQEQP